MLKKNRALALAITLTTAFSFGCIDKDGPHKPVESPSPSAGPQGGAGSADVVTYQDVKAIFSSRCSRCHPDMAPPNWGDYGSALKYVDNGLLKKRVIIEKSMPMAGTPEAEAITEEERELINQWVENGGLRTAQKETKTPTTSPSSEESNSETTGQGAASGSAPSAGTAEIKGPNPEAKTTSPLEQLVSQCSGCHGQNGISIADDIPNLAAQDFQYFTNQLKAFKSGEREDVSMGVMNDLVQSLSEQQMETLAKFYSELKLPDPKNLPSANLSQEQSDLSIGLINDFACASCHGTLEPGTPYIASQKQQYLLNQLKAFRDGQRPGDIMPIILNDTRDEPPTDKELEVISKFTSSVRPEEFIDIILNR